MKSIFTGILLLCAAGLVSAQEVYWVYFSDKTNTPFSTEHPEQFLSPDAVSRRAQDKISIRHADLPVDPAYCQQLTDAGALIRVRSKWLNAASVVATDDVIASISTLPFVRSIEPVRRYRRSPDIIIPQQTEAFYRIAEDPVEPYGGAENQNHMIEVDFLHGLGYRGQGVKIAVLDGGFYGVNSGAGFASLYEKGQILGTYNIPDNNADVFISSTHGSNVLSIMAVDVPNVFVGSAPDANYFLIRTEVTSSEYVIEEDYWLAGAEKADSLGADIINSSLGYTTFDDPLQDHTYADMDGNTTVVTRAADAAAAAGILVVNSAGNEGDSEWNFISAPADGDSVFTIGAVNSAGDYASFSSEGPTADGRIKPNVVGQGSGTAIMTEGGTVAYGSGTSYSSPLIAGACASFMSAFPELTNMQIIRIIEETATMTTSPNNQMGHGIPQFAKAYLEQTGYSLSEDNIITISPNPTSDYVQVFVNGVESANARVGIYDMAGNRIAETTFTTAEGRLDAFSFGNLDMLAAGIYVVRLSGDAYSATELLFVY